MLGVTGDVGTPSHRALQTRPHYLTYLLILAYLSEVMRVISPLLLPGALQRWNALCPTDLCAAAHCNHMLRAYSVPQTCVLPLTVITC